MKIDLATVVTENIMDYARYSTALNAEYAVLHGYGFHVYSTPSKERHPSWGKVEMARQLLAGCDWLFVIDADAVIGVADQDLDQFTTLGADLVVCENGPNGGRSLNGGAMLLRNTPAMHRFLGDWYESGEKYSFKAFFEQEALNDYYEGVLALDPAIKIQALAYDKFNSHWLDHRRPDWDTRFVLHLMTLPNDERERFFAQLHAMRSARRPQQASSLVPSRLVDGDAQTAIVQA